MNGPFANKDADNLCTNITARALVAASHSNRGKTLSRLVQSESVCRDETAKLRQPSHRETTMAARYEMLAASQLALSTIFFTHFKEILASAKFSLKILAVGANVAGGMRDFVRPCQKFSGNERHQGAVFRRMATMFGPSAEPKTAADPFKEDCNHARA